MVTENTNARTIPDAARVTIHRCIGLGDQSERRSSPTEGNASILQCNKKRALMLRRTKNVAMQQKLG